MTLIRNDSSDESMVSAGAPVAMHVLKVVSELHADRLIALQDPNNKLSEQLNILYAAPFGDAAKNFDSNGAGRRRRRTGTCRRT